MTNSAHIPLEDLVPFAMQSLSAEESARVRLHLEGCALCRAELAEVSGDLALVALSVDQHAVPEGARQRFIDRISADPNAAVPPAPTPVVPTTREEPSNRRPVSWASWGAIAALAIISVSLGIRVRTLNRELQNQATLVSRLSAMASRAQEVLEVMTSPSAQRVVLTSGKTAAVPTGRATYVPARGGLIFEASNLQHLPENKTYELWVIPANGTTPIPAGLFRPDARGSASVVLPPLPKGVPAKAFGVTIENPQGSLVPTAPIVLSGTA